MAEDKVSVLILKVDLECRPCYKKIRKVICQLQDKEAIKSISYDEKNNSVTISGPFDTERLTAKLYSKAPKVIKDIQVPKEKPKTSAVTQPKEMKPAEDYQLHKKKPSTVVNDEQATKKQLPADPPATEKPKQKKEVGIEDDEQKEKKKPTNGKPEESGGGDGGQEKMEAVTHVVKVEEVATMAPYTAYGYPHYTTYGHESDRLMQVAYCCDRPNYIYVMMELGGGGWRCMSCGAVDFQAAAAGGGGGVFGGAANGSTNYSSYTNSYYYGVPATTYNHLIHPAKGPAGTASQLFCEEDNSCVVM